MSFSLASPPTCQANLSFAGLHAYKLGVSRVTVNGQEAEFDIRDPLPAEQPADALSCTRFLSQLLRVVLPIWAMDKRAVLRSECLGACLQQRSPSRSSAGA